MKPRALFACVLLLAASALAQSKGIKPRANSAAFPASAQTETLDIGAAQLSASQVGHTFASPELGKGYIVVEIALFPKNGELKLAQNRDDWLAEVIGSIRYQHTHKQFTENGRLADLFHQSAP